MHSTAREKLRRLALYSGRTQDEMLEVLVHREWDRATDSRGIQPDPLPRPEMPACLEFHPDYRSTIEELRAAVYDALPGRELPRALHACGCERITVRRGSWTSRGWAGVRVRKAGAGASGGAGDVGGGVVAAEAAGALRGNVVAPPARPGGQDAGAVASVAADAPEGPLGGLGTDEVVA
jgi:hypothetical protein